MPKPPANATPASNAPRKSRRRWLFRLVFVLILGGFVEIGSYVLLHFSSAWNRQPVLRTPELFAKHRAGLELFAAKGPEALAEYDTELGWIVIPSIDRGHDQVNSARMRSRREIPREPGDATRVAAFGDSFVYGSEVGTDEAWPTVVDAEEPGLEVLNFGVPGYDVGQGYLRFVREAPRYRPKIALLGITAMGFERTIQVFGGFRETSGDYATKPRFILDTQGELELLPNPLTPALIDELIREPAGVVQFGAHDYWYEPLIYENAFYDWSATVRVISALWFKLDRRFWNADRPLVGSRNEGVVNAESSACRIAVAVAAEFCEKCRELGIEPLVLLFPDRPSVVRRRDGGTGVCDPMLPLLVAREVPHTDLTVPLLEAIASGETTLADEFASGGHYSVAGNRIIARALARQLRELADSLR